MRFAWTEPHHSVLFLLCLSALVCFVLPAWCAMPMLTRPAHMCPKELPFLFGMHASKISMGQCTGWLLQHLHNFVHAEDIRLLAGAWAGHGIS